MNNAFLAGYLHKSSAEPADLRQQPWYHKAISNPTQGSYNTYRSLPWGFFPRGTATRALVDDEGWRRYEQYQKELQKLGITPEQAQKGVADFRTARDAFDKYLDGINEEELRLMEEENSLEDSVDALPFKDPRKQAAMQQIEALREKRKTLYDENPNAPSPNEDYRELAHMSDDSSQKPWYPKPPDDRNQHSPPWTNEQALKMQAQLPNDNLVIPNRDPIDALESMQGPQYDSLTRRLVQPEIGEHGLETAFHEYTHAVDPSLAYLGKNIREGKVDRIMPEQWVQNHGQTVEVPAMAVERAVEASPYLPAKNRRPFTTEYGKQIDRHGPQMEGNIDRDLDHVKNWMQGLRSMPGARVAQREPFAYNRDKRTPEQRAQGLGTAYKQWMNYQADTQAKPAPTPTPAPKQAGQ